MRKSQLFRLAAFLIVILSPACNFSPEDDIEQPQPAQEETDETIAATPTPEPEATMAVSDNATYELYFDATWNAETHPDDYVASAHFSPFIAYGHSNSPEALIFRENEIATAGVELMAETGETNLLIDEIAGIISGGYATGYIQGARIDSPGKDSGKFGFSQNFSQVTFVSMIAPSPDWFVAANAELFQDGQWVDELTLELISFDSGTDSGTTFTAADTDTQPPALITRLPENLQNMGVLTLMRIQ